MRYRASAVSFIILLRMPLNVSFLMEFADSPYTPATNPFLVSRLCHSERSEDVLLSEAKNLNTPTKQIVSSLNSSSTFPPKNYL